MSYRSILVTVDDCRNLAPRVQAAARLAHEEQARLVLLGLSGVTRFIYETVASSPEVPDLDQYLESLRQRARAALERAEQSARAVGVRDIASLLVDEEAGRAVSAWAAYSDLVVISQTDPHDQTSVMDSGFPEYVVMHSGAPVLLVPCGAGAEFVLPAGKALVAWNGGREARRALADALPLLKRAGQVQVVTFNPDAELRDLQGQQPRPVLQDYLAAHGIEAEFLVRSASGKVGEALLKLTAELAPDLLVMGCYGHSRLRELVLGGTSRTLLKSSAVAILTSH